MTRTLRSGSRPPVPDGPRPWRTCVSCRRVGSQAQLVRLVRTPEGVVEVDALHRRGGRGAYLCPDERCVREAVRRVRWAHAFRAPAELTPETIDRLYALVARPAAALSSAGSDEGVLSGAAVEGRS